MNKEKLDAIKICILIAVTISVIMFGLTYVMESVARDGLRTVKECNQLQGTMKDNPENAEWVKEFPAQANQLQKDNCLGGLNYLDHTLMLVRLVLTPTAGITSGLFSYQIFKPEPSKQQNRKNE